MASESGQAKKTTNHWLILVLLALAQFMVVLDVTIVNVALPSIQHQFHLSNDNLQWIVTAYTLTFGGFLLLGGRTADLFGRRRTFLIGTIVFATASLVDGLAQSGSMLIVSRAVQGLAAAFMSPAALSIVLVTYKEGHERNVALSVWGAVASGGAAAGVLLGGIITQYLGWRWNFFINVPIGIGVVITALRILGAHESEAEDKQLDLPGAISVTAALAVLIYALVKAPTYGWTSTRSLIYFGVVLILLVFFVFNERRTARPLVPLRIFKTRNLSGADSIMLLIAAALYSVFFFTTLYVQEVLHYSPVKTGLDFLIIPVAVGIAATNVPRIVKRVGYKPILMVGPLLVAGGLFWVSHVPVNGSFWKDLAPGLVIMGLGMGANFVSVTIAATSGVSGPESGLASGLLTTSQQVGGSLGLAVLTGVATSATAHYLANLNLLRPATSQQLAAAQVHGYHNGYLVGAAFGVGAALLATFVIKRQTSKLDPSHAMEQAMAG